MKLKNVHKKMKYKESCTNSIKIEFKKIELDEII